ncbi:MAG: DMT family transporter [Caulobacteraceae bacterium]|nr:DMT family transporter [Caulobacter sp.]
MSAPASDRRALLVLLAGACLIGTGPIMVRLAHAGPSAIGFWRVSFAVPLLWLLARRGGRRGVGRPGGAALAAGVFFALDLAFWHYAIHYTSVANSTVLSNLTPVIVTAVSWLLFRERPRLLFLIGLAAAVAGAATMALARQGAGAPGADPPLGDALAALTAVWYSGYFLLVREARGRLGAAQVMFWSSLAAAPCLLLAALMLREPLLPAQAWGWWPLAGLALMHVGGQGAIAWALGRLPAALTAVVVLVQPVVAAALGWLVFGEVVTPLQALGGAVALGGVAFAQAAARRRPPPTQEEAEALA